MPDSLIDGTGSGFAVGVTERNRLKTNSELSETSPIDGTKNNPAWKFEYIISGTSTGAIGSSIGSVTQFIGTGSFVNVLTYSDGFITKIGSYS